jgi:diacylglycerol kinase family enzyme
MKDRPVLVICNPVAARLADAGRRDELRRAVVAAVRERDGREVDWLDGSQHEARAALADVVDRPLVVVAGGEGTVRDAAAAVRGTGIPLAVLPGGTGNVLAGAMGIGSMRTALSVLRHGRARRLDLGIARWATDDAPPHKRIFTVAAGMGFDARVMAGADQATKQRYRFAAYVGAALREAARLRPAVFHITADGVDFDIEGLVVLVANSGDLVPGRVGARRPIDPADGRLDLLVVGGRHILSGLRGAVDLLWRTGDLEGGVVRRAVEHVRVVADPLQPIQVDGDPDGPGWLEAWVDPASLLLLTSRTRSPATDPDVL